MSTPKFGEWQPIETFPGIGGKYVVGHFSGDACIAKWMPRKRQWVFPHAQLRFQPTHWMPLPEPPEE